MQTVTFENKGWPFKKYVTIANLCIVADMHIYMFSKHLDLILNGT